MAFQFAAANNLHPPQFPAPQDDECVPVERCDDGTDVDGFIERGADAEPLIRSRIFSMSAPAMLSCISSREPAQQTCP